jgi:hypothetical protein
MRINDHKADAVDQDEAGEGSFKEPWITEKRHCQVLSRALWRSWD